jgi:hypothetical protein
VMADGFFLASALYSFDGPDLERAVGYLQHYLSRNLSR